MPSFSRGRGADGGLVRMAERAGIRKGLNGSKGWFYLGTGLWTLRTIRRMAERRTEVLVSETIEPGQTITIRNTPSAPGRRKALRHPQGLDPQTRKERKAERKRAAHATAEATGH
jgi:hypothetical protein